MVRTLLVLLVFAAAPLYAEIETCGTTPELLETTRETAAWSNARARIAASKGLPQATAAVKDNVIFLEADETNAPYRRPFDLANRTLVFTPSGSGFTVSNIASTYDTNRGTELILGGGDEAFTKVTLDFDFPFLGRSVRDLYVSERNGIYLDGPPPSNALQQYGDLDLTVHRQAIIAPLLATARSLTAQPIVRVSKRADAAVVTWSGPSYDTQAVLSRNGEIRFSYGSVTQLLLSSAIVITSGAESWRTEQTPILTVTDPEGDQRTGTEAVDITAVSLSNIAGTDLYEARIQTRGDIVARAQSLIFLVNFGDGNETRSLRFTLSTNGSISYRVPVIGVSSPDAVRVDGSTLTMRFLAEHVVPSAALPVRVSSYAGGVLADSVAVSTASFPTQSRGVRTDFSAIDGTTTIEGRPVEEAFTLPILSVQRVWDQVRQSNPGLNDRDIDAVAIYQNFYTDLLLYAGAYSTGGNSGASGLEANDTGFAAEPRSPALMHMNAVGYGHNRTSRGASRVVMHEFGHRWLLFVSVDENGTRTRILNPVSAHPAQYVDTRAAFKVYTDLDTSVMGGGVFTGNADGTFSTGPYGPYGYSWLDLYLMGLAEPSEVTPFFYLAGSDPELGGEYYAPVNQIFRGTKKDVSLGQVISGTGTRVPAARDSQRSFRVVFVLLTQPGREPSAFDIDQMQLYRRLLESDFRTATGNRGEVSTSVDLPPSGPKRRAARR